MAGVDVELLVVGGCPHEAGAAALLREALTGEGLTAGDVVTTVVATAEEADRRGFVGSPTFAVDGADLFAEPDRSPGLACRIYRRGDTLGGLPLLEDLRRALRQAVGQQ